VVEQTLGNWVKLHRAGALKESAARASDSRADGDQSSACRAGSCDDGARHPGKSDGVLSQGPEVKYAFIHTTADLADPVQCRVLGVSVSGYHQHMARRREIARRRHLSDEALLCTSVRRMRRTVEPMAGRASGGNFGLKLSA